MLRLARKKFPGDFWANHDLGFYLCRTDPPQYRESIPYFTAAVALRPNLAGVSVNLGNAYRAIGDLDAAISFASRSSRHRSESAPGAQQSGQRPAGSGGDRGGDRGLPSGVADRSSLSSGAHAARRTACSQIGRADEAIDALEKAIKAEPADIETITAHADALKHAGRFADAEIALKHAHSLAEDNPAQSFYFDLHLTETEKLLQVERDLAKIEAGTAALNDPESIWLAAWVCHLLRRDSTGGQAGREGISRRSGARTLCQRTERTLPRGLGRAGLEPAVGVGVAPERTGSTDEATAVGRSVGATGGTKDGPHLAAAPRSRADAGTGSPGPVARERACQVAQVLVQSRRDSKAGGCARGKSHVAAMLLPSAAASFDIYERAAVEKKRFSHRLVR